MNEPVDLTEELNSITAESIDMQSTNQTPVTNSKSQKMSCPTDILQSIWGISTPVANAASNTSELYKIKHGMFASVPIICKADDCPYKEVCSLDQQYRIPGQRCPMEASAIVARFEMWCKTFEIDLSGIYIKDEDLVDVSLIRDLIENEIQTIRAENRIALNADFIGKTIGEIDNKGKVYYEDTVTPEVEFKYQLQDKRYKIFNLLNSTRKDKIDKKTVTPSEKAVSIFKKVSGMIEDIDDLMGEDGNTAESGIQENKEDKDVK